MLTRQQCCWAKLILWLTDKPPYFCFVSALCFTCTKCWNKPKTILFWACFAFCFSCKSRLSSTLQWRMSLACASSYANCIFELSSVCGVFISGRQSETNHSSEQVNLTTANCSLSVHQRVAAISLRDVCGIHNCTNTTCIICFIGWNLNECMLINRFLCIISFVALKCTGIKLQHQLTSASSFFSWWAAPSPAGPAPITTTLPCSNFNSSHWTYNTPHNNCFWAIIQVNLC